MAEFIEIAAEPREHVGKAFHHLSPQGKLPAVLYGAEREPEPLSLDKHDFELLATHEGLTSTLVHLRIQGQAKPVNVIVKEIQHDPVKGAICHVDFWAVKMTQRITTTVPVHFLGDSAGVKAGGVLTHNLTEVQIESLPADLPDFVEADISALEVGDSLHVSDLSAPEGVIIITLADEIVCSVTAPTIEPEVEEVEAVEEEVEPEVIGEEKEEE
jgi:large subunit ribosomal protein L25